ncbi:endo alpha-1,4 polygalactosaminidase [Streptomyces sp. NPDC047028]|uniref:endo alpha-1,4 polygalactosaminidase n=1 Tax=Streptomyces sp. NPDC047028 TaxID=3155793 RepID=UPI003400633B
MSLRPRRIRSWIPLTMAVLAAAATSLAAQGSASAATFTLPPVHGGFDYQIGGGYTPPAGVTVVSRDWKDSPAPSLYNICYVNAFQTQKVGDPGGPEDWDSNLLLQDEEGNVIIDEDWQEALLDISTAAKRTAVAAQIETQIDTCASKGFDALELDNYDSYTRSNGQITESQAQAYIRLLSAYGHDKGLAVGQKNTVELAPSHAANGLDFAIAEECGDTLECGDYIASFGDHAIFIEYTDNGLATACQYGDQVSIVQRDRDVVAQGTSGYVRHTC